MRKSDKVTVHYEKERWGESSPYKKKDGIRNHHEKKSDGEKLTMRKKAMG